MKDTERRVRNVRIPQNRVLDWFENAVKGWPERVSLPVYSGIPADAQVHSVHFDFMSRCFVFIIQHDSFSPVPEGEYVPPHADPLTLEYMTFAIPRIEYPKPDRVYVPDWTHPRIDPLTLLEPPKIIDG